MIRIGDFVTVQLVGQDQFLRGIVHDIDNNGEFTIQWAYSDEVEYLPYKLSSLEAMHDDDLDHGVYEWIIKQRRHYHMLVPRFSGCAVQDVVSILGSYNEPWLIIITYDLLAKTGEVVVLGNFEQWTIGALQFPLIQGHGENTPMSRLREFLELRLPYAWKDVFQETIRKAEDLSRVTITLTPAGTQTK